MKRSKLSIGVVSLLCLVMASGCEYVEDLFPNNGEEPIEEAPCVEDVINLNTGYQDASGSAGNVDAPDDDWQLVEIWNSVHDSLIATPTPALITNTSSGWATPPADGAWVSPGGGDEWVYYNGWFAYENCFTYDDCCMTALEATASIRADNVVYVYLNDSLIGQSSNIYLFSPSESPLDVEFTDLLRDGQNCLRVEVFNAESSSGRPTPHGLLVEGSVAMENCCETHEN